MIFRLAKRMFTEPDPRLLWKFMWNFGWKGMRAVSAFEKRRRKGEIYPAFLFVSITNSCNLSCQGCWVTPTNPPLELSVETVDNLIAAGKTQGSYLCGILGGEPLLHHGLFDMIAKHPDCYFILFTNGTAITEETAAKMRALGNVTPLISIEGSKSVSDTRRGGRDVYSRSLSGLELCRKHRLITGVATSVCKSNFDDLVSDDFVNLLIRQGIHYLWYYIYRPVGPRPSPELALSAEQILALRKFMVDVRCRAPIIIVDAYWDHEGRALCPAATGISHHIGPGGDVEPCPPIQFAADNIGNGEGIHDIVSKSKLLSDFRDLARKTTRGCILLDDPKAMLDFMESHGARDTTGRGCGYDEIRRMRPAASHDTAGLEIPEKHWMYRFAKKNWFFGFGAYG